MEKYILQILDENGEIEKTYSFKSLKGMHTNLNGVEYHQLRTIYKQSKMKSKFLHPHIQVLCSRFRILDNPDRVNIEFTT